MKTLYTKISENRKKEFEIITSIIEDNHQLYVYKQGVYDSKHVLSMEKSASLLRKYLPNYIDECSIDNEAFKTKFSKGKPLSELIVEGKEEQAIAIFKKIINSIPTKKFKDFPKENNKFYDIKFSDEEESFVLSNYDLTFFNIIFDNGDIKIIDYEWVYSYPIPKKAIIYRAFKQMKEQYPTLKFDIDKYLKDFGVKDFEKYDLLEEQFQKSVLSDFNYRVSFAKHEVYFDASIDYSALHEEADSIKLKNNEINEKALQLKYQNTLLEGHLENREERIKGLETTITSQHQEIIDKGNRLVELNSEVEERNRHIAKLDKEIEEKNGYINSLNEQVSNLDSVIKEKNATIDSLNSRVSSLDAEIEEKNKEISSLNNKVQSMNNEIEERNRHIAKLDKEIEEKNNHINSLNERISALNAEIEEKNSHINSLNERITALNAEIEEKNNIINSLNEKVDNMTGVISSLNEDVEERNRHIHTLDVEIDNKNRDLNNLLENYRKLDDEKEMYKIKSENYENSTTFKLMKPLWRFRDWLFPAGSKRRLFLKVIKTTIRHPIWTIKHLNGRNIRKFNKYLKSEGAERCLERIEVYESKNPSYENFNFELFNMKEREEYPELVFPYFKCPKVSIIIPVYNQFAYTYGCLESILKNTQGISYQVIIGDDCSTDETSHLEDYVKNVIVLHNKENLRFLLNCNNAAKNAEGQYILFLNNDTNVQKNWLSSLIETIESKENIGMVGSKLIYPDGRLQEAGGILWKDGSAWNFGYKGDPTCSEYSYRKPTDYISGAAIMIKKKLWNQIGGFDERFVPAYCEDSDLAFEVRKHGQEVVFDPFSVVVHYEGVSNGTDTSSGLKKYQVENSKKLYEKWKDVLAEHPDNGEDVFIARERGYNQKMILVIDHYIPEYDKDAGSRTVYDYLKIFVDLGYRVKFIGENFYKSEPYVYDLERIGIEVLYGPYYANNYKTWLKNNGPYFSYVFMNRPHITAKFIDAVAECCTNAKLIYYGHDLHFLRFEREYEISKNKNDLLESEKWKKTEFDIYKRVDLIYYPSVIEQNILKEIDPQLNVKVLQPYVYKDVKTGYNPIKRKNILFIGGFRHGANFDGVKWFINDIFPQILEKDKDIVFNIAGSYPPKELIDMESDNIHVLGFVTNEQLEKLYEETKMVVVPLRFGAGIKGKVIEAMRFGVPVITTQVGAEGISEDALLIDDNFESLLSTYHNNKKLLELSKKETDFIMQRYSYDSAKNSIKEQFEELGNNND